MRLNATGVASESAPLTTTNVDPHTATTSVIRMYARSFKDGFPYYRFNDRAYPATWNPTNTPAAPATHVCLTSVSRTDDRTHLVDIPIHHDEIRVETRRKPSLVLLRKLRIRRSLRIGRQSLAPAQLIFDRQDLVAYSFVRVTASNNPRNGVIGSTG